MATLYLVATPIGNLSDFSPRAVETLRSVDQIACEDTRTSGVLLQHFQINKPTFSFHQHNEHQKVGHIMNLLAGGQDIAVISDAGMPGISDPGFLAARAAHRNGHTVSAIPGPDAATTALAASGLPCDRYVFEGFLPPKKGRKTRIEAIAASEITSVIYVSPHKLVRFLKQLHDFAGDERWVCVARELTKKFEELDRDKLEPLLERWQQKDSIKGEFVVIVSGKDYSE
ncbi:16S rRNA (cytidine(1402)-2'-O)-methyltransferase [Rhodohalobacter mucosus]|uniref:Ribosomal RNA small subunit methyltransferase I n=1 Tax=Rhodohalobacter mucosus TaxID=2079485 RepID=A0A316TP92_9BACT|nr:16S rRNA (cytidine(1402)-2'-O)-methyltransferase [Rhodohalobacter mucosus]PWN06437.1 16S rRNA (cytidine(1402)-2'-O)-methyltransferase [Rhodohalobacter mucosus]